MAYEQVPEVDVLIATGIWLHQQSWQIESISLARGQGIDAYEDKHKLFAKFSDVGIPVDEINFNSSGPDITARQDTTE